MTIRFYRTFVSTLFSFVVALTIQAELPSDVKEILEKSIEATGGREKIEAIKSSRMIGEFSMPAMGMTGKSEVVHSYPNKIYILQEIPGMGEIVQAFDGEKGWAQDPMQGFRALSDQEIASLKQNESISESLNYEDSFISGEVLGEADVDGEAVWKVKLVDADTEGEEIHYYGKESGLLLKMELEVDMGPMGRIPAEMLIKEYGTQDGVSYPSKMVMSNAGMEINLNFNSLELNPEVDDSLFTAPQ